MRRVCLHTNICCITCTCKFRSRMHESTGLGMGMCFVGMGWGWGWFSIPCHSLTERLQSVAFGGSISTLQRLLYGVLQGPVLGPLPFALYSADVIHIAAKHEVCIHAYMLTTYRLRLPVLPLIRVLLPVASRHVFLTYGCRLIGKNWILARQNSSG